MKPGEFLEFSKLRRLECGAGSPSRSRPNAPFVGGLTSQPQTQTEQKFQTHHEIRPNP